MSTNRAVLGGMWILLCCAGTAFSSLGDWAEGSPSGDDGANHTHFNRRAQLAWRNREGDWRDADGRPQGKKPFAVAAVDRQSSRLEWDVTELVRGWAAGTIQPKGLLLRNTQGTGNTQFHSREADAAAERPQLTVTLGGQPNSLAVTADTYLTRSTYRSQGTSKTLRVENVMPALLRFDPTGLNDADKIEKAVLRLSVVKAYCADEVGVFACDQGEVVEQVEPLWGIAAKYPRDRDIGNNPDILFATGFESDEWRQEWTKTDGKLDAVSADPMRKFEPLDGKACRGYLAQGELTAMNSTYQFRQKLGYEPEEIYFRYYVRFGDDWNQTIQGGKMPGVSGTYGRAGWGGRKVDGKNGWSARGSFGLTFPEGNPLAGRQPLGWYCYHADMAGYYGDVWVWSKGYHGYLENNRWYCIEQFVKLNTLRADGDRGNRDGILRVWIDGRPAFEKTDIRFRDVDALKIEQIWMNVYHGGTIPSPHDQHLYVDNVVVARQYIGPLADR